MADEFELTINYPPNQAGQWVNGELDDQIVDAIGQDTTGSGAGPLTGGRDLHFSFDNRLDAEQAVQRLKVIGDVEYKWNIVAWYDDGSHRTLAMGQSKAMEKSE